jgi:hypothetical protein
MEVDDPASDHLRLGQVVVRTRSVRQIVSINSEFALAILYAFADEIDDGIGGSSRA